MLRPYDRCSRICPASILVNAVDLRTITGAPLQLADEIWGLALTRLQADLPDTLPGQNVTVVLMGDIAVENAVPPEAVRQPVTPIDVTASAGVNLRYVENIFWPVGRAPAGTYRVGVDRFSTCGGGNATWTLTVRVDGQVVLSQSGQGDAGFSFTR